MATPELADAFLSKFGRELESKVRLVSYGSKLVDVIDRFRPERDTFLRGIGIDSAKISIVVGHNASPSNQHEAVLREIAKLQEALRSQIAIVIPMTYTGTSSSYVDSIRVLSEQLQLPVRILDQRLSLDDVARLRVATDILIHVPISDQFSAAMCESLVGGAVLITGGWLPYRRLRASGVQYHEVFEVGAIAKKLGDLLDRFQFERSQVQKNVAIVRNMMSWQSLVPQWTKVYDELLNSGTSNSSRVPGA
jgi:4-alpha-L-fucosyltransferase glycosyl transferase group 56